MFYVQYVKCNGLKKHAVRYRFATGPIRICVPMLAAPRPRENSCINYKCSAHALLSILLLSIGDIV